MLAIGSSDSAAVLMLRRARLWCRVDRPFSRRRQYVGRERIVLEIRARDLWCHIGSKRPSVSAEARRAVFHLALTRWEFLVHGVRYRLVDDPTDLDQEVVQGRALTWLLRSWAAQGHAAVLESLADQLRLRSRHRDAGDVFWLADRVAQVLEASHPLMALVPEPRAHRVTDTTIGEPVDLVDLIPESPPPPTPEPDHWVEVVLLDSGHEPIANERYELVLPDGKTSQGRTDDEGMLRIDPIFKAGNCQLYFPDLEAQLSAAG